MSDEIPEDANIYFCALKKSQYLLRDIVIGAAEASIYTAIIVMATMVVVILSVLSLPYLKMIIDFLVWLPLPVYLIIILALVIYSYSLLWCYNRKLIADEKKICVKYGIDPEVFKTLKKYDDTPRVYIRFDENISAEIIHNLSKFQDNFQILHKDGVCVIGSVSMDMFVRKVKYFESKNVPITAELSDRRRLGIDGWA